MTPLHVLGMVLSLLIGVAQGQAPMDPAPAAEAKAQTAGTTSERAGMPSQLHEADLPEKLADLEVEAPKAGGSADAVVVIDTPHGPAKLTGAQLLDLLAERQKAKREGGILFVLFNITSWMGMVWVGLGIVGQLIFTGRLIVQWLASEKHKRSVVPTAFWWMSLVGASMLLMYFTWRQDLVAFAGQSAGWLIYVRNLYLIYRHKEQQMLAEEMAGGGK
ncbi:MAG: lipid-A-disaccharide synthase N-terminal domain-containing protein [Phycisphaeraceae bacterium]|nr:lipid-A-disaccharide synthase N-terminal domain-containing protein [Phycisphaeraceae bacterium]